MRVKIATYDVFAQRPFNGNQAAVLHEGRQQLSDVQFLALASELSVAETAISSVHGHELRFRFANTDRILQRCGHASLAAVADHVFSRILQQQPRRGTWTGTYRVGAATAKWRARTIRGKHHRIVGLEVGIAWPDRPRFVKLLPVAPVYRALGLKPGDRRCDLPVCVYDSGNLNALVPVRSLASLKRAKPDWAQLNALFTAHHLTDTHLYVLLTGGESAGPIRLRCRNVFPYGLLEETATGTASVALAAALIDHLPALRDTFRSRDFLFDQGDGKRRGTIHVGWRPERGDNVSIWLKGRVFPVVRGYLESIPFD